MKTIKKILCVALLLIFMLLGKQGTVVRKFSTDWSGSKNQENIQTKEITESAVMDINMNVKDRQSEIFSAEIKYKMPEQRGSTGNRYFDEAEAYWIILAEYEYAIKSNIETYENGVWENVEDLMFYSGKKKGVLYYCLKDLSNDGHPELIISTYLESENEYLPGVIYHYSEEKGIVWSFLSEGMTARIYDGGIVEMEGSGAYEPLLYYRFFSDDSGDLEFLGYYTIQVQDGEAKYFEEAGKGDGKREISEKEYKEIIAAYTAVLIDLEYLPIEGFCEAY